MPHGSDAGIKPLDLPDMPLHLLHLVFQDNRPLLFLHIGDKLLVYDIGVQDTHKESGGKERYHKIQGHALCRAVPGGPIDKDRVFQKQPCHFGKYGIDNSGKGRRQKKIQLAAGDFLHIPMPSPRQFPDRKNHYRTGQDKHQAGLPVEVNPDVQ